MTTERKYILDKTTAARKMERMAYEMAEQLVDEKNPIILAGIKDNGVVMARILAGQLKSIAGINAEIIEVALDKRNPGPITVEPKTAFNGRTIVMVDDVTNSGKTLLYALQPFLEEYPKQIQVLTLVERTHKAFPVKADYVGISIATTLQEHIYVEVEGDAVAGAYLE